MFSEHDHISTLTEDGRISSGRVVNDIYNSYHRADVIWKLKETARLRDEHNIMSQSITLDGTRDLGISEYANYCYALTKHCIEIFNKVEREEIPTPQKESMEPYDG